MSVYDNNTKTKHDTKFIFSLKTQKKNIRLLV